MTRVLFSVLAVLGMLGSAVWAQTQKEPVLTPVTVAVTGFHCQACPDGLQADLAKLKGASDVKALLVPPVVTAKLDESVLPVSTFVNAIAKHPTAMDATKTYGAQLRAYIDTAMCAADEKMCPGCFTEIPKVLKALRGVADVKLDDTGKVAAITFTRYARVTTADLTRALASSDYHFTVSFTAPEKPKADGQQP